MPYTLADYKRLEKDPLKAGVIDVFLREAPIMDLLTFDNTDTLVTQSLRTAALPSVAFRKIGGTFADSKGRVEPVTERVFDLGGLIDIDKLLVKSKTVVDQQALQIDMYVTAMAYAFQDYFINGDPTVDEDGFTGLWYRSLNYWPSANHINKNGLDISPDAASLSANEDTFLDAIDEAIDEIDGDQADYIVVNKTVKRRFYSIIRKKGLWATTKDNFGRKVVTYGEGGPRIIDAGVKADQTTLVIGNSETNDGTALTGGGATSLYFCRLGEKYLRGIQLYPMDVDGPFMLENRVQSRVVVDWPVGIMHIHPRAMSRLSGIIAA